MKAIMHTRFGPPEEVLELREADVPAIGDEEVLVRVRAVGVSRGDWLISEGVPYVARPSYGLRSPKHPVAGQELAGTVEAVGAGVTRFTPGDEVFGWGTGGLAEYAAIPERQLAPKPARITFEQAAAVPVSGFAALQALRDKGEVQAGRRVLVVGASGGVGTFAVQIAKALGAEVTGVCSTRNVDMVRSIGADHVVDYSKDEITAGGRRFDLIVDIAGNRRLATLRRTLAPAGTLVIVGGSGGRWTMGFGRTIRAILLSPFVRHRLRALISSPNTEDLLALGELIDSGRVTPVVGSTHPLAEAPAAIARVGAGRGSGKAAVVV